MAALVRSRLIIYAKMELAMSIPHSDRCVESAANDERRWKLFISNRVKEIQDLPQLLDTLYYERQSSRLGQQWLPVAHASCEHHVVTRAGHQ
ncbi:hypothetical protein T06_6620 [Trichinella sp. T6]|nr:hypothetical protein T06_6620 [Trichinella sp. T6]